MNLGVYQIKQNSGYNNAEVEDRSAERDFYIAKEEPTLLRAKLFSRHRNQKEYTLFIKSVPDGTGHESIHGWYCNCISGSRTLGMCSHVCAVIWYLSIDRYEPVMKRPTRRLLGAALDAAERYAQP